MSQNVLSLEHARQLANEVQIGTERYWCWSDRIQPEMLIDSEDHQHVLNEIKFNGENSTNFDSVPAPTFDELFALLPSTLRHVGIENELKIRKGENGMMRIAYKSVENGYLWPVIENTPVIAAANLLLLVLTKDVLKDGKI